MKKYLERNFIFYLILIVSLLLPLLFMAISNDIAIFMTAGKTIAEGKQIYVDYIDIKPPFFFQIYAIIYAFFGFSEMAPRIADLIIQLLTCIFLYEIFSKFTQNKFLLLLPGIIYSILYVSLSSSQTGYPESFIGIFVAGILLLIYHRKINYSTILYLSVLSGLTISMKYTFVLPIFPLVILAIFRNKLYSAKNLKFSILFTFLTLIVVTLTHFPLFISDSVSAFKDVLHLISNYSTNQKSIAELTKDFLVSNSEFWGFHISFFVSFGVFISLYEYVTMKSVEKLFKVQMLLILLLLSILSIIIEAKFSVYMFSRMLVPIALLSAIGFLIAFKRIVENKDFHKIRYLTIFILLIFIFSPAIKYSKSWVITYTYLINKNNELYQIDNHENCRVTYIDIAQYVKRTSQKDNKILIISNGANILSYFLSDFPQYPFAQSMFYLGKLRINSYRSIFLKELHDADILIINTVDGHHEISGNYESSLELLYNDDAYISILNKWFEDEVCFDSFIIYRKRTQHL